MLGLNKTVLELIAAILLSGSLIGCAAKAPNNLQLQQGKTFFKTAYYKKAMQHLLPLAVDGNCEAQYAVGYMYYYGYGVPQDTETGCFWITRAADQQYLPAVNALRIIQENIANRNKNIFQHPAKF